MTGYKLSHHSPRFRFAELDLAKFVQTRECDQRASKNESIASVVAE
jgi:hypothetical protein